MTAQQWRQLEETLASLSLDEKRRLIDRLAADLKTETQDQSAESQKHARSELLTELDQLPVCNPDDGFTSADHDRVIYGDGS